MTARDRTVIMVVLALGAIVAGWLLVVSPKRSQASALGGQVTSVQSQLTSARSQVAAGEEARTAFAGQYAQLARLGEAVPPSDDIPSLIYQVQSAAQAAHVSLRALQLSPGSSSSSPSRSQLELVHGVVLDASAGRGRRRRGSSDRSVHVHARRQLLQPGQLLQPRSELRGQQQKPPPDQRPPHDHQRHQPRARLQRVPPDHRQRLGDDLHRSANTGPHGRRHDGRTGHDVSPAPDLHVGILELDSGRDHRPGAPMSFFPNLIKELRDRKLWPIAIGLIVALVAVPVVLSKKASTDLVTPQPTGGLPYSTGTTLPAISVQTTASSSKLPGRGRNPFTPQVVGRRRRPPPRRPRRPARPPGLAPRPRRPPRAARPAAAPAPRRPLHPARPRPHRRPPSRPRPSPGPRA